MAEKTYREIPSFLNYYESRGIQDCVEDCITERINPISGNEARTSGTLKFFIPGTPYFINPDKTDIYLTLKLVGTGTDTSKTTSTADIATTRLSIINNIAHSIFRSVRVKMGNQYITLNQTDYAYLAYMQILLNSSKEAQDTYFNTCGWIRDTAEQMDKLIGANLTGSENKGIFFRRHKYFSSDSESIGEFIFKPHTAISFAGKCVIPYIDMEYEFTRNDNSDFYLMHDGGSFKIEIVDAHMEIQKYRCSQSFISGVETMLSSHEPITYKLRESIVNTYTIPSGVQNYNNDMLFHGKVPLRIIIGFVSTEAYNGNIRKNPFNFSHFNLESVRLLKNGLEYPLPELITDFKSTPKKSLKAYNRLMKSMGSDYNRDVVSITPTDFNNGYFLLSYLMTPDQESGADKTNLANKPSSLKLELRFSETLSKNVQMIVYYEAESTVTVDYTRNIVVQH